MPKLNSPNGTFEYGPGHPTALWSDYLRIIDQPPIVLEELMAGRIDIMVDLARWVVKRGIDILTIMINHPELDDVELAPRIAHAVQKEVGCPLGIDGTRDPEAVEAFLSSLQPYNGLMLTVTGEQKELDTLLPIIKRYNAVVGVMPMGHFESLLPLTAESRLKEAKYIVEICEGYGISQENISVDAIVLAAAALEPNSFQETLDTIQSLHKELGVTVQAGTWNTGHGLPEPRYMELAALMACMTYGVDVALVAPDTPGLIPCVRSMDFLKERDVDQKMYFASYRSRQAELKAGTAVVREFDWSPYDKKPKN
jgi:5-methyltetrahydrofolate--homocysteine methyltransferase